MLSLALDTSTPLGSVALGEGGQLLAESILPVRAVHSEAVLPEIDRLLRSCGRSVREVERVVVGAGPGSFTGVRIAAAVAKGLRAATDARLLAFASLAAIAAGTGIAGPVCAAIDARRGQVYAAGYEIVDRLRERFPPRSAPLEDVLGALAPAGDWTVAGTLPPPLRARTERLGFRLAPPHVGVPRASALLWLADLDPAAGAVEHPELWEPVYVRASSAERETAP
ncbi:MAG: tRNA (adenosine(37)-N6)-threonylcarbamoyltransferase complex dimerization subunit type 1 TsaB [Gemmatimonadota bacterium]